MWKAEQTQLANDTIRFQMSRQHHLPMTVDEVIDGWVHDPEFRQFYYQLLAAAPFPAFFWELPPMTLATIGQPFEFILKDSPGLARVTAESRPFQTYFTTREPVVVFPNLGGDATLIVPTPEAPPDVYPHLARFLREGPATQIDWFWQQVGDVCRNRLSNHPFWLSTSGLGVYWVHVRLDSRPKYYTHAPYRRIMT